MHQQNSHQKRDMYNNRSIYQPIYSDMAGFCESLPVPARHNSKYGTEDMHQSMMLAATRNGNVAACLMAQQDTGAPSPEWFRLGTDRMNGNVPQDFFRHSIIKQPGMMKSLVWMPKEGLTLQQTCTRSRATATSTVQS